VFHALQAIDTPVALRQHVKLGASWEGFALEQAIRAISLPAERFFFWRTHAGAEVDLFWQTQGKSWAVECKFADAPRISKGLYAALADLGLAHLWIVYPGSRSYARTPRVTVLPLADVGALWKY
jgi:predicted AAA+ superfamily ATPase